MRNTIDQPKLLKDPDARAARISELQNPHIKPLTDFVAQLRKEVGHEAEIPDLDPWDGGVNAEILFLLEAPGRMAVHSRFISRNNNDESAKNFFGLCSDAGISRDSSVVWNIVPWYIGSGKKIRQANDVDLRSGSGSLTRFLKLLPRLRVIILVGSKAKYAEEIIRPLLPHVRILKSYHPSPQNLNTNPGRRDLILNVFQEAAEILKNPRTHF